MGSNSDNNSDLLDKASAEPQPVIENVSRVKTKSKPMEDIRGVRTSSSSRNSNTKDKCKEVLKSINTRQETIEEPFDTEPSNEEEAIYSSNDEHFEVYLPRTRNQLENPEQSESKSELAIAKLGKFTRYRCCVCDFTEFNLAKIEKHCVDIHQLRPSDSQESFKTQHLSVFLEQGDLSIVDENIGLKFFKFLREKKKKKKKKKK